jgi:hypothetical protein
MHNLKITESQKNVSQSASQNSVYLNSKSEDIKFYD